MKLLTLKEIKRIILEKKIKAVENNRKIPFFVIEGENYTKEWRKIWIKVMNGMRIRYIKEFNTINWNKVIEISGDKETDNMESVIKKMRMDLVRKLRKEKIEDFIGFIKMKAFNGEDKECIIIPGVYGFVISKKKGNKFSVEKLEEIIPNYEKMIKNKYVRSKIGLIKLESCIISSGKLGAKVAEEIRKEGTKKFKRKQLEEWKKEVVGDLKYNEENFIKKVYSPSRVVKFTV